MSVMTWEKFDELFSDTFQHVSEEKEPVCSVCDREITRKIPFFVHWVGFPTHFFFHWNCSVKFGAMMQSDGTMCRVLEVQETGWAPGISKKT